MNSLIETVISSTNKIYFDWELRKLIFEEG